MVPSSSKPLPYVSEGLDVPTLLEEVIKFFNRSHLIDAKKISFKKQPLVSNNNDSFAMQLPCEAVHHAELFSIIRSWIANSGLAPTLKLFTNVNVPRHFGTDNSRELRCDLLLADGPEQKYAIELVAHTNQKDLEHHYKKTVEYKNQVAAIQAYVVHFTTMQNSSDFPYPTGDKGATWIHI
eukprot:CAMPEP_0168541338 /NCGR_PEP_ID=MMETSP0413-20121227/766_1 /TAXON_ID=136452 /ORGANISM="Filamoeba nolandi, Strain NC-AS-23-1" /LENGTH=180 /DNA_ID=CAMNT_0008571151 /DNA_START=183 /DNA_END=725 /DNA_ORIENTATION=-